MTPIIRKRPWRQIKTVHYDLDVNSGKSGVTKPGGRSVFSVVDVTRCSKRYDNAGNDNQYKKPETTTKIKRGGHYHACRQNWIG